MTSAHDARAAELVAALTLPEKIQLLSGASMWTTAAVAGIPAASVANGPNGVGKQASDGDHVGGGAMIPATCFPAAALLASTWDQELITEVGAALGREARALDVDVLLGPGLNIKRHPGGGRVFEYFSEDPFVSGKVAAALVRGVQSEGVGTSIKHFAGNNQETDRMRLDSVIDERTLREIYLAGFEIAVREAEPWTVMTSYNLLNGEHTGESEWLLTTVLREDWGFDGLVMTDWFAMADRPAGIRAGLDLEMPGNDGAWTDRIEKALAAGEVTQEQIDAAAGHVVALALRGHAEREGRGTEVDFEAHHALARRAAAAGTVLLRNDGLLPLAAGGKVALIGAGAETPRYQGVGSAAVNARQVDSALDALRARVGDGLVYARGHDPRTGAVSDADLAGARDAAASADVAVLLLAVPAGAEAEGVDRADLSMPEDFTRLVRAVVRANPRTVVVLVNGAPLEVPWADEPAALVEAYLGGEAAGPAIIDVLFGDAEPGGRLTESFPVRAADLAAAGNFPTTNGTRTQVQYRENLYVGYRFHDTFGVAPRFPFGHGLGYTSFAYGEPAVTGSGVELVVSIPVTNTGDRAGSEVVQLYVHDVESTVHRPDQELKAFAKVHLQPGETATVELTLGRRSFASYDVSAGSWVVEAGEFELRLGASSRDIRASATVTVESTDAVTAAVVPAGPVATDAEFARLLGGRVPAARGILPYTTDSTINDLRSTWLGRRLHTLMLGMITRSLPSEGLDDETKAMMTAVVGGMPLRAMVANSGGKLSFDTVDRVLGVLNAASPSARRARR